jgi:DNA-binding transcriptional LysR family regulator
MKWNVDDLPVFVAVSEMRGIRAAAEKLNMPKSTVSRTLSRLEDGLDFRLFDRNTRQLRLTAEGAAFLGHAQAILEEVMTANEAVAGLRHSPSGLLKVALPMAFSREVIGGQLAAFNQRYPEIVLEVMVTPYLVNLMREDVDLALVVGPVDDSDLMSQKISDTPLIWVASPDYAAKHDWDDQLARLKPHIKFCEQRYKTRRLAVKTTKGKQYLDTSMTISVNDSVILRDVVRQGGGVGLLPELYCRALLNTGELVQVCPSIVPEARAQILALTVSRRLASQKTRLFIEFVRDCVAAYLKKTTKDPFNG